MKLKNIISRIFFEYQKALLYDKNNITRWKELKGRYKGERVFLIGNGPSLNETPLYLLENEYTMCFNRFNLMFERLNWLPTFYMSIDSLVAKDISLELNEVVEKVEYAFFPNIHTDGTVFSEFIKKRENILWMSPVFKGFQFDLPKVAFGGTVAYPALQVLVYLGFTNIYLVGVDMNYKIHETTIPLDNNDSNVQANYNDDPNHFDPRYFGKGRKYHQPKKEVVNNILNSFDYASKILNSKSGISVINTNEQSKVESFEKVRYEKLFVINEEEKFQKFSRSFGSLLYFSNYLDMINKCSLVSYEDALQTESMYFIMNKEEGARAIAKIISDYIPYGPYNDKYLFISRVLKK
jgi:hypothetical protein